MKYKLKLKRKTVMITSLVVICLLGYFTWMKKPLKGGFNPSQVSVTVTKVTVQDMPTLVRALGSLTAIHDAEMASEMNGIIESVPVSDGAMVQTGDLLIKLEDATEQARVLQAQAQKQLKAVDYNRVKNLQARGAVSQQELDKNEADMKVAEAELLFAQSELDKTFIKAPFSGQLGVVNYSVGQYITAGQPLVRLVDKSSLHIDYSVPQNYLELLKLGAEVSFETSAYPKESFKGEVNFISPAVDLSTRTLAVQAKFDNSHGRLSPGLSGTVFQVLSITPNAIVIPEQALVPSITGYLVYRIVDGKALATPVEIATRKKGEVQIVSGLNAEDLVVVEGHQSLRDGAQVNIVENGE